MDNLKDLKRESRGLQRAIYLELLNPKISHQDRIRLQSNFTKNFYEILQLSFDSLITKDKLISYERRGVFKGNPGNLVRIAKVIEHESTYANLNCFLKRYLEIISVYSNTIE